ncbi:odorant receptor 131-2-like [Electrophorus electricus]|uniref:odorant receptor 131-2-like n=1 Tax=Electrophorus electricus TaxID=8005 RepID=UPI0015D075F5|nr:odorant receptor 131-2-like [Electrophorus electricus]
MQNLDINHSLSNKTVVNFSTLYTKVIFVQILVGIFLYVNCLMIYTFLKKEMFREETRYILFAQTLLVDSAFMVLSDVLLIWGYYQYVIHTIPCLIICTVVTVLTVCTPLTLVAMCLERYVAICMPLRHADISTSRTRFRGLLIIWSISSMIPLFTLIAYLAVIPSGALLSYTVCSVELMLGKDWQAEARSSMFQVLFLFMIIIIAFTYIKIMIAARAASSENKKLTKKGLRTVILHAVQLLLCLMQFLNPYIEMIFWKVDIMLFVNVRYSNFIVFIIAPHCLSPLIYGLRDEKFFLVLRHHAMCGLDSLLLVLLSQSKIRPK